MVVFIWIRVYKGVEVIDYVCGVFVIVWCFFCVINKRGGC